MDFISILLIALGLAADCFAVSISGSIAMRSVSPLQVMRTALAFGSAQALMPVLGWLAGLTIVNIIADYDHWIALLLLGVIGGRMVWQALRPDPNGKKESDISRGFSLVALAVATSIDALAIGLTFAFLDVNIGQAALIIGVTAALLTMGGFLLGRKAGRLAGRWAEVVGGVVLLGIGIRLFLTHLLEA